MNKRDASDGVGLYEACTPFYARGVIRSRDRFVFFFLGGCRRADSAVASEKSNTASRSQRPATPDLCTQACIPS